MKSFLKKRLQCVKENGWYYTWRKLLQKLFGAADPLSDSALMEKSKESYKRSRRRWRQLDATKRIFFPYNKEEKAGFASQRKAIFPHDIQISILVLISNPNRGHLKRLVHSLQDQTFSNWELCFVMGSNQNSPATEALCQQYVGRDSRIAFRKLEGIKNTSNLTGNVLSLTKGNYIGLVEPSDFLYPSALFETAVTIRDKKADVIYTDEGAFQKFVSFASPIYKPDYSPDMLRSENYMGRFLCFKRDLAERVKAFQEDWLKSQEYDLVLRLTEKAEKIVHIPQLLYYHRISSPSAAVQKEENQKKMQSDVLALERHLQRIGWEGEVLPAANDNTYRIRYKLQENPLVSILIPNYEHIEDLRLCLKSVFEKTTYANFEIIIIENNSKSQEIFEYYKDIERLHPNVKVVTWNDRFNYSAINNFGCGFAQGEYILLLNNDIEVLSPDWIQEMLMFAQRPDVGAVGAMLYYPDDTVQHAGVIVGLGGVAGHSHKLLKRGEPGYMNRAGIVQNLSAVTAACCMIPKRVWNRVKGLDEAFQVAFNDVDLCMRIRQAGFLIVWTPYAEMYHYESKSRGQEDTEEKKKRFQGEIKRFQSRWERELEAGDPYYNPNLTLRR